MRPICIAGLAIIIILHLHMSFIIDCLSFQFIFIATLCTIPAVCVSFIVSASSYVHMYLENCILLLSIQILSVSSLHLEYCTWCLYT